MGSVLFAFLALTQATPPSQSVEFVYLPDEVGSGSTNVNLVSLLFDYFKEAEGTTSLTSAAVAAFLNDSYIIIPDGPAAGAESVLRFFRAEVPLEREVLDPAFPILTLPWEINFQLPSDSPTAESWLDYLEKGPKAYRFPGTRRVTTRLLRLRRGAPSVLAVELQRDAEVALDPMAYSHQFTARVQVDTPRSKSTLVVVGKTMNRASRMVAELQHLAQQATPAAQRFVLHPGGALNTDESDDLEFVAGLLEQARLDAAVPMGAELALGPTKLQELARKHKLPYLAANLYAAGAGAPIFAPYILRQHDNLNIVIIGVVGPKELSALPAAVRASWRVDSMLPSITAALAEVEKRLGRRPDLTVLLAGCRGDDFELASRHTLIDLVFHPDYNTNLEPSVTRYGREDGQALGPEPRNLVLQGDNSALAQVQAHFAGSPLRLHEVVLRQIPLALDGPVDPQVEQSLRKFNLASLTTDWHVALPDAARLIAMQPKLAQFVWGKRILRRDTYTEYEARYPARYATELWLRLVAGLMRDATAADVALISNYDRSSDMIGEISQAVLGNWLPRGIELRVADVSGAALLRLAGLMEQRRTGPPKDLWFAAGMDTSRLLVAGRRIRADEHYRVALPDSILSELAVDAEWLAPLTKFAWREGRWEPTSDGAAVQVKDLIQKSIDTKRGAGWRDDNLAALADLPAIDGGELVGRWRLALEQFSLSGNRYRNEGRMEQYAVTKETRASTPDNYALSHRGALTLLYDGPSVAWDNRLKTVFDRTVIELPDVEPQEQMDDALATSELRWNAVQVNFGSEAAAMPLVPFVQAAYDTEFTRTQIPETKKKLPRQRLLRQAVGVVLSPGQRFTELRVGAVAQQDIATSPSYSDYGALLGAKLGFSIWGPLAFDSVLDARYFARDDDDRPQDLELWLSWVSRLTLSVNENIALFGLADVASFRGKIPGHRAQASSVLWGGGIDFHVAKTWQ